MNHSSIYEGTVTHERFHPQLHSFRYHECMFYLDIDEISRLFSDRLFVSYERSNLCCFRRRDYLCPQDRSLRRAVQKLVMAQHNRHIDGPIRILTHLRTFGFLFNPVTFYYCFSEEGHLEFIISDIENTPWGERHPYVHKVTKKSASGHGFKFKKDFHVSPFFPMDINYYWMFTNPTDRLACDMYSFMQGKRVFHVSLDLARKPLQEHLYPTLFKYPLVTWQVVARIYWQALRLWVKKVPFFSHPNPSRQQKTPFF